jgi:hypothetical protein
VKMCLKLLLNDLASDFTHFFTLINIQIKLG